MQKLDKQFIKKVRRQDRLATRAITVGGLLVIASVIAILVLIVRVTLPLFQPARAEVSHRLPAAPGLAPVLAVGMDNTQEVGFVLDETGLFSFYDLASGKSFFSAPASERKAKLVSVENNKSNIFTLLWEDSSATVTKVDFKLLYAEDGRRTVQPEITPLGEYPARQYPAPVKSLAARSHEGRLTQVALLADNRFQIDREVVATDLMDNETRESFSLLLAGELPGRITAFTVDEKGETLYAGTDTGNLARWNLKENESAELTDKVKAVPGNKAITALAMVFGDISVAVGDAEGGLTTWSQIWAGEGEERVQTLRKTHTLTSHQGPVERIIPTRRTKALISIDASGKTHFDHMTSENHLLALDAPLNLAGISGQGNGLIGLAADNSLTVWKIDAPHPEISLKTLFGKVWYESYGKPEYVWQSSSGTDDFEAKFSLVPLLFGTLKGTLYAMIFAVPLAIFGAVYTSQFSTATFKKTVKPVVEIMASIPSVVIGFLIALWLAPIVEKGILSIILGVLLLPLIFVAIMAVLKPFYKTPTLQNFCNGHEFLLLTPVILLAAALAMGIAPYVEQWLFAGNFKQWLYNDLGMRYDQRNCIIIAFGLGIAVIPIIFSITEDAISNIPPSLTATSLALGASRWQTIWRVVLPSASPGIFAAIMIGFGRAVGETMIVLMATGNTPILDWSIFNGMRTLSANIAVEIPEAPFNGTLYRVLFLCSSLLFALTFVVNTGAELVRERLRKKYGRY